MAGCSRSSCSSAIEVGFMFAPFLSSTAIEWPNASFCSTPRHFSIRLGFLDAAMARLAEFARLVALEIK